MADALHTALHVPSEIAPLFRGYSGERCWPEPASPGPRRPKLAIGPQRPVASQHRAPSRRSIEHRRVAASSTVASQHRAPSRRSIEHRRVAASSTVASHLAELDACGQCVAVPSGTAAGWGGSVTTGTSQYGSFRFAYSTSPTVLSSSKAARDCSADD